MEVMISFRKVRKQLVETLILSRIDHNDSVSNPILDYLIKCRRGFQLAAARFVVKRFVEMPEILSLGWLPIA